MSKYIVYTNHKGIISVVNPTQEALNRMTIEQIAQKDVPSGTTYKIVSGSDFPTTTEFRNAWVLNSDNNIEISVTKAKDVWKEKIRIARKPALEKLDVDYNRAVEDGNSTTQIVADKNTLRNLPDQVDTATTVDEIKAVWNDMLGDKD